jgi:excisionase family DNA binding protein
MADDTELEAQTLRSAAAAKFLKVHPVLLRRMCRAGRIPAAKVAGRWLFIKADLEAWLRDGGEQTRRTEE